MKRKIADGGLQKEKCKGRYCSRGRIAEEELKRKIAEGGLQKEKCHGRIAERGLKWKNYSIRMGKGELKRKD